MKTLDFETYLEEAMRLWERVKIPVAGAIIAMILTGHSWTLLKILVVPLYHLLLRVIGLILAIGLGLGLAAHVYEQLDGMHDEQQRLKGGGAHGRPNQRTTKSNTTSTTINTSGGNVNSFLLQDEQTYPNLMTHAGYTINDKFLRGQVVPPTHACLDQPGRYPFDTTISQERMQQLWPTLPSSILGKLAQLTEYIVRDFVGCWYYKMDPSCTYPGAPPATEQKEEDTGDRRMVYSLKQYRPVPFLDALYESMAILFGNLATRVEHISMFEIVLLHWTKILAHTFRVYRQCRKSVQAKHEPVTEMNLTKEFLFANKLHKALTFGLDVPSLLFGDANGKECGTPGATNDDVLEHRLFATTMMQECELDYNRVVAHRMVKALLPRNDFSSPIVASLCIEIMAGSVLSPIMRCFGPDYLNNWINKGLGSTSISESNEKKGDSGENQDSDGAEFASPHETDVEAKPDADIAEDVVEVAPGAKTRVDSDVLVEKITDDAATAEALDVLICQPSTQNIDLVTRLSSALMELETYVDFDDFREAKMSDRDPFVNWGDVKCREAVLELVLIIEAALSEGRCTYQNENRDLNAMASFDTIGSQEFSDDGGVAAMVEADIPDYGSATLSQLLMEMTSDIDAFEERIANENAAMRGKGDPFADAVCEPYKPDATEQSTMRTLIAAWLHSGNSFRMLSALTNAKVTVLLPYYTSGAVLRSAVNANAFVKQLRALEGVEILVDTMAVLSSPRLSELASGGLTNYVSRSTTNVSSNRRTTSSSMAVALAQNLMSSTPRFCDFNRNEAFASSLRSERERRMQSWNNHFYDDVDEGIPVIIHNKGCTEEQKAKHLELHSIAQMLYGGTNSLTIRDAARNKPTMEAENSSVSVSEMSSAMESTPTALLTLESVCPSRKYEVPDDDSNFLLRAQPRALNPIGVHRDQRTHDQSFKSYAATYEEPALIAESRLYKGGRYVRPCTLRYYPIDRTAQLVLGSESRKLDQRKPKQSVPDTISVGGTSRGSQFLSADFVRERHLCQKWNPRGTTRPQGLLSGSVNTVMEPNDFAAAPRHGKALDFVYRMAFFEKPMIDLGGKHFTVQDSSIASSHRADASALEISDPILTAAVMLIGDGAPNSQDGGKTVVEVGKDGYPIVYVRQTSANDEGSSDVKPYRVSFVRAALLVADSKKEARIQSLIKCVKESSARKANAAQRDALLKPTSRLLEYAGNRSREKQGLLLRDLKLGINHIDREQLRRNGLIEPRYPTSIRSLSVTVEEAVNAEEVKNVELNDTGSYFKIRCVAVVELIAEEDEMAGDFGYRSPDGTLGKTFKEEWVVYRNFKEFQSFHKQLKSQVSASESSGTAGSRLVGAASAAFSASVNAPIKVRNRDALVPSLASAQKVGTLGMNKKALAKRVEFLKSYIEYLFGERHLLNRSTEALLFVGAFFPFPPELNIGELGTGIPDPLGRTLMRRTIIEQRKSARPVTSKGEKSTANTKQRSSSLGGESFDEDDADDLDLDDASSGALRDIDMKPAIRSKIDRVLLPAVRARLFELLRYQFGFENASFVRNRMLAGIKTVSIAVTSKGEFRKTLYKLHTEKFNAEAVAGWIQMGLDLLWPQGVFFTSSPPYTEEMLRLNREKSKETLHKAFPEALTKVLGQELTDDGIDILHEMLQNRLVVRSMSYMLFDLLWLEVFPEIGDVLECGAALD